MFVQIHKKHIKYNTCFQCVMDIYSLYHLTILSEKKQAKKNNRIICTPSGGGVHTNTSSGGHTHALGLSLGVVQDEKKNAFSR